MVTTIPITQARINLGSIIKKVHLRKEYVILEKDGYPVAGIMDIDEFEDYLEANNPRIQKEEAAMRKKYPNAHKTTRPVKELLAELKALERNVRRRK